MGALTAKTASDTDSTDALDPAIAIEKVLSSFCLAELCEGEVSRERLASLLSHTNPDS